MLKKCLHLLPIYETVLKALSPGPSVFHVRSLNHHPLIVSEPVPLNSFTTKPRLICLLPWEPLASMGSNWWSGKRRVTGRPHPSSLPAGLARVPVHCLFEKCLPPKSQVNLTDKMLCCRRCSLGKSLKIVISHSTSFAQLVREIKKTALFEESQCMCCSKSLPQVGRRCSTI